MMSFYPNMKNYPISRWTKFLLLFKPTYVAADYEGDHSVIIRFKYLRGITYIVGEEVAPWTPKERLN